MMLNFQLKDFDGPLDLLLTLIGKAQIDIQDIFVSQITEQYLEIVHNATDLDMDEASDFLVMAATLLEIKSRSMLPRPSSTENEEEDPEQELIRKLEEYKRFKETCLAMKDFEQAAFRMFTKLPEEYPLPPQEYELIGLDLENLTKALFRIMNRKSFINMDPEKNHYVNRGVHRDEHNVEQCMIQLRYYIQKKKRLPFSEVFSDTPTREEIVTLFLALLELLKLGEMHTEQSEDFGEILLVCGRAEGHKTDDDINESGEQLSFVLS